MTINLDLSDGSIDTLLVTIIILAITKAVVTVLRSRRG